MKTNIAVFFGGVSVEHDISILTGVEVLKNINRDKYKIFPIYITKEGRWRLYDDVKCPKDLKERRYKNVFFMAGDDHLREKFSIFNIEICEIHSALLCMHGTNGEDGVLQGVLEASGVAYTSAGVKSSSITMDKALTKTILKDKGFNVVDGVELRKCEWYEDYKNAIGKIEVLEYPLIVKPASLGSSIGVRFVENREELREAVELVFEMDEKCLIETKVEATELNCSAMRVGDVESSEVEMIVKSHDFLTFEDKYLAGGKGKLRGEDLMQFTHKIPAPISNELKEEISFITAGVYNTLECDGVIRVDYMLSSDGVLYVNEVNTIPGSLAFYLWRGKFDFSEVIDNLISQSLMRKAREGSLIRNFESHIV